MEDNPSATTSHGQVQVYFSTNSADIELLEEKRQLRVPTGKMDDFEQLISSC
jgi:hypothetical protein